MMALGEGWEEPMEIDTHSVPTILFYMKMLLNLMGEQKMELTTHILDVIERCIFKLKWNMKREIFIKSEFFRFFGERFSGMVGQNSYIPLELRSRVSKIITTLTFDDVLDEYKFRIARYITTIKEQPLLLTFYDLTGVFTALDANAVSRFFFRKLQREFDITALMEQILSLARERKNEKLFQDLAAFCRLIVMNRGLKVNNNPVNYEMAALVMPTLIELSRQIWR